MSVWSMNACPEDHRPAHSRACNTQTHTILLDQKFQVRDGGSSLKAHTNAEHSGSLSLGRVPVFTGLISRNLEQKILFPVKGEKMFLILKNMKSKTSP